MTFSQTMFGVCICCQRFITTIHIKGMKTRDYIQFSQITSRVYVGVS